MNETRRTADERPDVDSANRTGVIGWTDGAPAEQRYGRGAPAAARVTQLYRMDPTLVDDVIDTLDGEGQS